MTKYIPNIIKYITQSLIFIVSTGFLLIIIIVQSMLMATINVENDVKLQQQVNAARVITKNEKLTIYMDGYNDGYKKSVIDSFYLCNIYIVDDKSDAQNAILYKQVDLLPIHKGVK